MAESRTCGTARSWKASGLDLLRPFARGEALILTTAIPTVADMTPGWWTETLRRCGLDVTVASTRRTKIGTGQLGESVRFHLEYTGEARGAPATVVGKFPSADEGSLAAAKLFGAYRREISFYQELAGSCGMATPPLIYADFNPVTQRFILLMGDLSPAEQGDQTRGVTLDQARLALLEAAKLHASHWDDAQLTALTWLMGTQGAFQLSGPMMAQLWAGFRERFENQIDQYCIEVGEVLVDRFDPYIAGYAGPRCLIHNDFRPDNMAFATRHGGRPITIFDWQTVGVGCGMNDIAYFMGCSLTPESRRAEEGALIHMYHDALRSSGIGGYSFHQAWEDYRRYSVAAFSMAMTMSMMVERTERGDAMFIKTAESAATFVRDVDGLAILRSL